MLSSSLSSLSVSRPSDLAVPERNYYFIKYIGVLFIERYKLCDQLVIFKSFYVVQFELEGTVVEFD